MAEAQPIDITIALVLSIILLCKILLDIPIKKWSRVEYLNESSTTILIGLAMGGVLAGVGAATRGHANLPEFNPRYFADLFNLLLLPLIIFAAGFTVKKRNMLRNFGSILAFSTLGLVVSTAVIGFGLYAATIAGWLPDAEHGGLSSASPVEALLFGSLLSATDPVATLAVFHELNVEPLVYSLVFGESVLNDALAIVLYKTLETYRDVPDPSASAAAAEAAEEAAGAAIFEASTLVSMTGSFLGSTIASAMVGITVAVVSAIALKRIGLRHLETAHQIAFVFLAAYVSYLLAEVLGLSGIMALFLCGVFMSHYHWYSLSPAGRVSMLNLTGATAWLAETVVFLSIGFLVFASTTDWSRQSWSPSFIVFTFFLVALSRFCNIFPLSFCLNLRRRRRITLRHQLVLWFAGLRGAIAMILALQIDDFPARELLINTTLLIVLATNLFAGPATKPFIRRLGIRHGADQASNVRTLDEVLTAFNGGDDTQPTDASSDSDSDSSERLAETERYYASRGGTGLDALADGASRDLGLDSEDYDVMEINRHASGESVRKRLPHTSGGVVPLLEQHDVPGGRRASQSSSRSSSSSNLHRGPDASPRGSPFSSSDDAVPTETVDDALDGGSVTASGLPRTVTGRSRVHEWWRWFDDAYVKPYLGGKPRNHVRARR